MENNPYGKWSRLKWTITAIVAVYVFLMIPECSSTPQTSGGKQPFVWNQDKIWAALETRFNAVRKNKCAEDEAFVQNNIETIEQLLQSNISPLEDIERLIFETAPVVAACPPKKLKFAETIHKVRKYTKTRSIHGPQDDKTREKQYRLLYGSRIAEEQLLLQGALDDNDALVKYDDVSSVCPEAVVHGVKIRSGDILLSRGGAATSALIARGNDFPGNFSHVALVHVDEKTHTPSVIEAHIEKGVAIATADQYFTDTKLRILVLRPRPNLKSIQKDPMLPHKAATTALERAATEHIPYDFAMDWNDPSELFCSEVASSVYKPLGIELWKNVSTMSSPGLVNWLGAFGVLHFQTQGPSDLEYDPQLSLVAEWRDPETLRKDHIDNAVVDAMLERAESGQQIEYNHFLLPPARMMKFISVIANLFGDIGPVPEGMSATAALKNTWYSDWHESAVKKTNRRIQEFQDKNGYYPPYWQLVALARQSL